MAQHPGRRVSCHQRVPSVGIGADHRRHDHRRLDCLRNGSHPDLLWSRDPFSADFSRGCDDPLFDRLAVARHILGHRRHGGTRAHGHRRGLRHPGLLDRRRGGFRRVFRRQDFAPVGHNQPCPGRDGNERFRSHPEHDADDHPRHADRAGDLHLGRVLDGRRRVDILRAHRCDHLGTAGEFLDIALASCACAVGHRFGSNQTTADPVIVCRRCRGWPYGNGVPGRRSS